MKAIGKTSFAAVICLITFLLFSPATMNAGAYVTVGAEIPVSCLEVADRSDHTYEIRIESENDDSPAPNSDTLSISENGLGYFEINITEPGTYRYRIYETAGNDPDIEYDSNIYSVVVFVENSNDDELIYTVTANAVGSDSKTKGIEFKNIVLSGSESVTTSTTTATTSSGTATSSAVSNTTTTTAVTTTKTSTDSTITTIIENVLTGDTFPAHALRIGLLASVLTAIAAFLFKHRQSEEEEND